MSQYAKKNQKTTNPNNVNKNKNVIKRKNVLQPISSRIPRPKTPLNKIVEEHTELSNPLPDGIMLHKTTDPTFLQLYITKVYLIQDSLRKHKVINKESKLDDNALQLAEKITELCHKIKDVESQIFIGSSNLIPKIEFGPGGDIESEKSTSAYLDSLKDEDSYSINPKSTKNIINASSTEIFSPGELTFDNIFGSRSKDNKKPYASKITQEIKTRTINFDPVDNRQLSNILDALTCKTEEMMGKIGTIDQNIKQLNIFWKSSQTTEICQYCKIFFEELKKQKQDIKEIVDSLNLCVEQMSNGCDNQKIDQLSSPIQNILQNTIDLRQQIETSNKLKFIPLIYDSTGQQRNEKLKKNQLYDTTKSPDLYYCQNDYLTYFSSNPSDIESIEDVEIEDSDSPRKESEEVCQFSEERYNKFKTYLKANQKPLRKFRKKKPLHLNKIVKNTNDDDDSTTDDKIKNNDYEKSIHFLNKKINLTSDCSNCSISSKKLKNIYKNNKISKNNSSCKEYISSWSFRNLNISESLKLNEDYQTGSQDEIQENEENSKNTSSSVGSGSTKNSHKVLKGTIINHKAKSDQIVDDKGTTSNISSSDKYAKIVMELNDIVSHKKNLRNSFQTKQILPVANGSKEKQLKSSETKKNSSLFSFKKHSANKKISKQVQYPSISGLKKSNEVKCPNCNELKRPQGEHLNTDLSEKACLCKLCDCKSNTANLTSKTSVANYLCELLNTTLKCEDKEISKHPESVHVNIPFIDEKEKKDQNNLQNKSNSSTLHELYFKKFDNNSSKSIELYDVLIQDSSKESSFDLLQSRIKTEKKKSKSRLKFSDFLKKRLSKDHFSMMDSVDVRDSDIVARKQGRFSLISRRMEDLPHKNSQTTKSTNIIKNNKSWKRNHNNSNSSSSIEKSSMEFVDLKSPDVKAIMASKSKDKNEIDVLYNVDTEPCKLKHFAYESVTLLDKPYKETEIVKYAVNLTDVINNNEKITDYNKNSKTVYTSSCPNKCKTDCHTLSNLENPLSNKSIKSGKYILCISNDRNDIKKLETLGLTPIEVDRNSDKTWYDESGHIFKNKEIVENRVKCYNLNRDEHSNLNFNDYTQLQCSNNYSILAKEIGKFVENNKKLEEVLWKRRVSQERKMPKEQDPNLITSTKSKRKAKTKKTDKPNVSLPSSSKEEKKRNPKNSFFKRLLSKKQK